MKIDIRNPDDTEITSIKFAEGECVDRVAANNNVVEITTAEDCVEIYTKDIENLIKALQKAKELWG